MDVKILESWSAMDIFRSFQCGGGRNRTSLYINADTVAGELAAALGSEKLILLTDTAGILKDYKDPSTLLYKLDIQELAD